MGILLDPNVAYLVLVMAFLLSILALLVPGTGVIEIFALFGLVLAGYSIYNLPVNYLALVILLLGVIPFALAVRKSGRLLYLALSILALVVGSVFLFRGNNGLPAVNPLLAVLVSGLATAFLWLVARKTLEASLAPPVHNVDRLIGKTGETTTEVNGDGSVQIDSELWSAHSEQSLPAGTEVRVVGREGFSLLVEKVPAAVESASQNPIAVSKEA